jgi:hypothetical protein
MAGESADREGRGGLPDPAGAAARSMGQLAQQMREMAERMLTGGFAWPGVGGSASGTRPAADTGRGSGDRPAGPPGLPAIPGMPPMPGLPATPASMSARQLQAVVDDIAARRSQVQALVVQLNAFDEQLGTLEASLRPLLQWLRTWSDLEGAVTDFWTPRARGDS